MEPIDSYIRQAREIAGDERQAAIAELQKMAIKSVCPETAVTALIDLWRENFAAPEDLAPFGATLLENWKRTYERVKPFQQETVKVEWVMDDDYAPVSREAEALLALLGYCAGEEIGYALREALQELTDPDPEDVRCTVATSTGRSCRFRGN